MTARSVRQYFGPSARHARACVELSFEASDRTCRLAGLESQLAKHGLDLCEYLPDAPLPIERAVAHLAAALLSSRAPWWHDHGREGGRAFAALGHPHPPIAALALDAALDLAESGDDPGAALQAKLRRLAELPLAGGQIRMPMTRVAELLGRDAALPLATSILFQIGQGAKGLHFVRMSTQRDSLVAMRLEQNKHVTAGLLRRFGLPATHGVLVRNPQEARDAIAQVGLPCVVKPTEMGLGDGVSTGLTEPEDVAAAADHALRISRKPVLIENHVEGLDHRLMVIGDELLWVYRKVPAVIEGDGETALFDLIRRENARRAATRGGTEAYLYKIPVGRTLETFLARRYALRGSDVLERGRRIELSAQANIARGGVLEDVTGTVHPDNRTLAIRVARLMRMGTLGIDFITPDISRSWKEVPCAIIEVNRSPGISGVGDAATAQRALLPNRRSGRIPIVAVVGSPAYRAHVAGIVEQAITGQGLRPVAADYLAPAGETLSPGALAPEIETLILDVEADAGLILCDPERIADAGLPLNRCDLVLVEDGAPLAWLGERAETVIAGKSPPDSRIERAVAKLVRKFLEPDEGGPLPVLEPLAGAPDAFRLRVWRARAMPRAWFWRQLDLAPPRAAGLTTYHDLLAAVRALAQRALAGDARLPAAFAHGDLPAGWVRLTFEATLALPPEQAERARDALTAATDRVNAVAGAKGPY